MNFQSCSCFKEFEEQNIEICVTNTDIHIVPLEQLEQCSNTNFCMFSSPWTIERPDCTQKQNIFEICKEEFETKGLTSCKNLYDTEQEMSGEIPKDYKMFDV